MNSQQNQRAEDLQHSIAYIAAQVDQVVSKLLVLRTDRDDTFRQVDVLKAEVGSELEYFPDQSDLSIAVGNLIRVANSLKD